MAVAARVYNGDEKVTEFINDDAPTILALVDADGSVVDYLDLLPIANVPTIDTFEDAILAWSEAGGLFYDHNDATRAAIIGMAAARGDVATLAILGVGGRKAYDDTFDESAPLELA